MDDLSQGRRVELRETLAHLYSQVDELVAPLLTIHADRLVCAPGCCRCCRDDLTVFQVEAENIRMHDGVLLREEAPGAAGACALLDGNGQCRIYTQRPYVCRTQGLPLRWLERQPQGEVVEYRDICPLNDHGTPIEGIAPEHCWVLGPVEEVLVQIQEQFFPGTMERVPLRSLFSG